MILIVDSESQTGLHEAICLRNPASFYPTLIVFDLIMKNITRSLSYLQRILSLVGWRGQRVPRLTRRDVGREVARHCWYLDLWRFYSRYLTLPENKG